MGLNLTIISDDHVPQTIPVTPAPTPDMEKIPRPQPIPPSNSCWRWFTRLFCKEKNPLLEEIKQLAIDQGIIKESSQKIDKVLEALQSIDFSRLKSDLKKIIGFLNPQERKELLTKALRLDFDNGQKILGNQCLNLLTVEQMREMAGLDSTNSTELKKTAQDFYSIVKLINKYDVKEQHKNLIDNSKEFVLFRMIRNFVRTIAVAFNLLELGREPNTYFETKYMLDIYWRLLEIPVRIIKFIFDMFVNPIISFAVAAVGTVVSAIAFHLFRKIFNKCPQELPYCTNLTAEMKKGTIKPVFGREDEVEKILSCLAANNETGRKHPMIMGERGVGKSALTKALAWKILNGEVPEPLKSIEQLFFINCAALTKKATGFSLKDPLEQIMEKIGDHRKKVLIVFDEAECLVDNLGISFNTILDTTLPKDSLFYAIGITTPEHYKTKIAPTDLDRRFSTIPMKPASKEQTRIMMRTMKQQQAQDVQISTKVLDSIYNQTNKTIAWRKQPDSSIFILSNLLEKIRYLQNGGAYDSDLQDLMRQRNELISQLSEINLHSASLAKSDVQNTQALLKEIDRSISEISQDVEKKKAIAKKYSALKDLFESDKKWLHETNAKIVQDVNAGKEIPEMLQKAYIFHHFFLNPLLENYIKQFTKEKIFETEITEKMVTESVNELAELEKIKAQSVK
jgi:ATP-dependent Clp protease ATP-binding subunit ClpA